MHDILNALHSKRVVNLHIINVAITSPEQILTRTNTILPDRYDEVRNEVTNEERAFN